MNLTDSQIARLFVLCDEIAKVRTELPIAPRGFDVSLEQARSLRESLEKHKDSLMEIGYLLVNELYKEPEFPIFGD